MKFFTLKDFDFKDKKALVRVDYNVPLGDDGKVRNDKRIRASLPTLNYLLENGAKIIIMTSAGRPKGRVVENFRTTDIASVLSGLIGKPVKKLDDCIGRDVSAAVDDMKQGSIIMLENLRFHTEEEANDKGFAKELASLAGIYVNDAFANCHREHASMHAITRFLPSCAGMLLEKEVSTILKTLENPEKPFVVVMGGVKLETKLPVIESLLKKTDKILLGSAMSFSFYKAQGKEIGKSKYEKDKVGLAGNLLKKAGDKLVLPVDVVVTEEVDADSESKTVSADDIPSDMMGVDIGEETVELFRKELEHAKTVIWNGPMGVFEIEKFAKGTNAVAETIAGLDAVTVIGGGDSAAAVEKLNLEKKFTLVSTGGGASLKLIEKGTLPALEALEESFKKEE